MKKVFRILLLIGALVMYWEMVVNSKYLVTAMSKIGLVAVLLMAMEVTRRQGEKLYEQKANIQVIDKMAEHEFREYVAQSYKKLGYYIQPSMHPDKTGYDFIVHKDRQFSAIKCFKADQLISKETIVQAYELILKTRRKHSIFITNENFSEEALDYLKDKNIEIVERRQLIQLIDQTKQEENQRQETTKVQET